MHNSTSCFQEKTKGKPMFESFTDKKVQLSSGIRLRVRTAGMRLDLERVACSWAACAINAMKNRPKISVSCSFDRRVIGGYDADMFVQSLKPLLETPAMLLIEGGQQAIVLTSRWQWFHQ